MKTQTKNRLLIKRILGTAFIIMSVLSSIIIFQYAYVSGIGYSPEQRISFSHKLHIEKYNVKCVFCHYTAPAGDFSNIPTTRDCMVCHIALLNESDLMTGVNYSYDEEIPIQWKKVWRAPSFARFSHSAHINAMIDCSSCHGEVETLDSMKRSQHISMSWCIDCHRSPETLVIPAREISGIYDNEKIEKGSFVSFRKYEYATNPYFGGYLYKGEKPLFKGMTMPHEPGKGPENCSACHY